MGLCLSCRCGEAQHKAKRFLDMALQHVCRNDCRVVDKRSGDRMKRTGSLSSEDGDGDDHLVVPHSSELFSLPNSPAGSRNSTGSRSSRSSTRTSISSHKKVFIRSGESNCKAGFVLKPGRKSCSSLGQVADSNKSLAETIARLEMFCDVKLLFLENRTTSLAMSKSATKSSILLHESCRDLAAKLRILSFASDVCIDAVPALVVANSCAAASLIREAENVGAGVVADEIPETIPSSLRGPSLRCQDADEFTNFEASFEVFHADTPAEADRPSEASIAAENSAANSAADEPGIDFCQSAHRRFHSSSDLGDGIPSKSGPKIPILLRSALKEVVNTNVTPANESSKNRQPLKRGASRSLDSQSCSLSHLQFERIFKSERWQLPQGWTGAAEKLSRMEAEAAQIEEIAGSASEGENKNPPSSSACSQFKEGLSDDSPQSAETAKSGDEDRPDSSGNSHKLLATRSSFCKASLQGPLSVCTVEDLASDTSEVDLNLSTEEAVLTLDVPA